MFHDAEEHQYATLAVVLARKLIEYILLACLLGVSQNHDHSPSLEASWHHAIDTMTKASVCTGDSQSASKVANYSTESRTTSQVNEPIVIGASPKRLTISGDTSKRDSDAYVKAAKSIKMSLSDKVPTWGDLILDADVGRAFDCSILHNIRYRNHSDKMKALGILLYGPSRTGKTLLYKFMPKAAPTASIK